MYKLRFFILVSTMMLLVCCNVKTEKVTEINHPQVPDYVIDEKMSSDNYSDIKGYLPKEGLVPTEEVAVQIAESVLSQIYGKEKIEGEKPFSIKLENDVWIIEGHLDDKLLGGVAYMEIRKYNGEILKVIHTK